MKTFDSKYFTPPLSRKHTRLLWTHFGLEPFPFPITEVCGETILRTWESFGLPSLTKKDDGICIERSNRTLSIVPSETESSLWSRVLPYPLSELPDSYKGSHSAEVFELRNAFQALETKMVQREVNFWCVRSKSGILVVLFHFVRGKCVRVGVAEDAYEAAVSYFNGNEDPSAFVGFSGISPQLFKMEIEPSDRPLVSTTEIFRKSLRSESPPAEIVSDLTL